MGETLGELSAVLEDGSGGGAVVRSSLFQASVEFTELSGFPVTRMSMVSGSATWVVVLLRCVHVRH